MDDGGGRACREAGERHEGIIKGFISRYGLICIVHYETFPMVVDAIQREKNIKHWPRAGKDALIATLTLDWRDFDTELLRGDGRGNARLPPPLSSCPDSIRASPSVGAKKMAGTMPGHDGRRKECLVIGLLLRS